MPPVWPTVAGQQQMGMHLDIAGDGLAPMSAMDQRRDQFEVKKRAQMARAARRRHSAAGMSPF